MITRDFQCLLELELFWKVFFDDICGGLMYFVKGSGRGEDTRRFKGVFYDISGRLTYFAHY